MRREAASIAPKTLAKQSANRSLPDSPRGALLDALNSNLPEPEPDLETEPESPQRSPPSSLRRASLSWVAQLAKPGSARAAKPWKTPQVLFEDVIIRSLLIQTRHMKC